MSTVRLLLAIMVVYLLAVWLMSYIPEQLPAAHPQCYTNYCQLPPPPSNEIRFQREQQKQYLEKHGQP